MTRIIKEDMLTTSEIEAADPTIQLSKNAEIIAGERRRMSNEDFEEKDQLLHLFAYHLHSLQHLIACVASHARSLALNYLLLCCRLEVLLTSLE